MVFTQEGTPLNATFLVESRRGRQTILWRGRWHKNHNRDYLPALEVVLARLGAIGAILTDAMVESEFTERHRLSVDACRLPPRDRSYPLALEREKDPHELRLALLHKIGQVGLPPGRPGGHTPLKQLRLFVTTELSDQVLGRYLTSGELGSAG